MKKIIFYLFVVCQSLMVSCTFGGNSPIHRYFSSTPSANQETTGIDPSKLVVMNYSVSPGNMSPPLLNYDPDPRENYLEIKICKALADCISFPSNEKKVPLPQLTSNTISLEIRPCVNKNRSSDPYNNCSDWNNVSLDVLDQNSLTPMISPKVQAIKNDLITLGKEYLATLTTFKNDIGSCTQEKPLFSPDQVNHLLQLDPTSFADLFLLPSNIEIINALKNSSPKQNDSSTQSWIQTAAGAELVSGAGLLVAGAAAVAVGATSTSSANTKKTVASMSAGAAASFVGLFLLAFGGSKLSNLNLQGSVNQFKCAANQKAFDNLTSILKQVAQKRNALAQGIL